MRYKHLAGANVDISELTIGTWAIGGSNYGEVNDNESILAIRKMIANGVNTIDTAAQYGAGHSEEVVGKAIKGLDRTKLFVCTKFGQGETTLQVQRG